MHRIAHLSDIHFGRISVPQIVEDLVAEINAGEIDLVAVSGDLTQRARRGEFRKAVDMLDAFTPPTIVVPGNHDVYPWWRPLFRLSRPLGRYRRYITDDLTPTYTGDGLAVLGINSAHGQTVKGGRIGTSDRAAIEAFFTEQPLEAFRVLVVHHHLTQIQALGPHDVAHQAKKALEVASRVGVDLVLCGHLHVSHIEPIELSPDRHPLVIASAGTATSNRGRASNRQVNFYNIIDVTAEGFTIHERRYDREGGGFSAHRTTHFKRST